MLQNMVFAQATRPDTLFLTTAAQYQRSVYDAAIGAQSRLYNGGQHRDYLSKNDESPYFGVDDWQYGFIIYDDERYDSVGLFYDLSRDQVITEHMRTGSKIELIPNKVAMFEMNGHLFERLYPDSGDVITEGFYERLYSGSTPVYVKRTRNLISRTSSSEVLYSFEEKNRIFIRKAQRYYPVKSRKSVLRVLNMKPSQMRALLKREKLFYKSDRERAIVLMARAYDSTTP